MPSIAEVRERFPQLEITNPLELIESWYVQGLQGVVLGHQHGNLDFHHFAASLIVQADALDLSAIYFEKSTTWQTDLDSFRQTGGLTAEFRARLETIKKYWGGCEDNFAQLQALRTTQCPAWFLDCPEDRDAPKQITSRLEGLMRGRNRDEHMLAEFADHPPTGKFLIICGNGHAPLDDVAEYDIRRHKDVPFSPLARLVEQSTHFPMKSVATLGSLTFPFGDFLDHFNERVPEGTPAFALKLTGENCESEIISRQTFQGKPISQLFDAIVIHPHATFNG